jgi:two-component system response regulator FixJ
MERICIVDDDAAVRDSLSAFLGVCGYAVACFATALAVLDAGEIAGYACMVVDVHMPGMNGLELLELLRARGVETPAVLITGAADAGLRAQAEKLGRLAFLEKPVDGDTLLDAIADFAQD